MMLTPEGRLSRYFYGVEYAPRDVRLGLVEASQNKIGNPVDQMLLFCFHYDPATGKYGAIAMNMVRVRRRGFRPDRRRRSWQSSSAAISARTNTVEAGIVRDELLSSISGAGFHDRARGGPPAVFPAGGHRLLHAWGSSRAIFYFAVRYRRRSEQELPHVMHGGMALEIVWTVIPFGLTMVMFAWGASLFFRESRSARRRAADLRGRQAVDVEAAAHGRAARDQRTAHSGGPPRKAHHDVRRRDPQLLRPGLPHQAGRGARPLLHHVVRAHQGRASITCSAPSTAAPITPA